MNSFNINATTNSTMINSNNNLCKNSNIENSFEHNSPTAPPPTVNSYQNQNQNQDIQTTRRNSQKDNDHPFHNASGSNAVAIDVTTHETEGVRYGKCKWFNVAKGWGFITPNDGGNEVFVHQSVIQMDGFRSLGEQEDVEFECHLTKRGLEATRVSGSQGSDCHGSTFRPRTKKRHRRVRCYNCGEFANHIASKCHLGPQPKRCHLCKQDDHLFANCPTKKNQSNESFHEEKGEEAPFTSNEDDVNIKPDTTHASR